MKDFLLKIVLSILVLCGVLFWGGELFLRCIPNDYKTQKSYLESHAEDIKILVLGASSASRGVLPRYFDIQPSYNCAYSARSIDYDYHILEKYIHKMDSLRYVILDMNYTKLWWKMGPDNRTATYLKYYSIYWGISLYKGFENNYEMSTSFTDIDGLKYKYSKSTLEYDGYQSGHDTPYNEKKWREYGPDRIASFMLGDSIQNNIYNENIDYIKKIVELCEDKDVRVIVVWVPVDKTISDYYDEKRLLAINVSMNQLEYQYANFTYLDLYNDLTFTYMDMMNPDHLNRNGAIKLTKRINDYINGLCN